MRAFISIIIFTLFLYACQEEKEMLTGEISGTVKVIDQYFSQLQDRSGVEVKLFRDDVLLEETLTGTDGSFVFENIGYGKYSIPLHYEDYVESESYIREEDLHIVYHVGGYSPTRVSYSLYEVPTWELSVDSITPGDDVLRLKVYLKVNGDTLPPALSVNPYLFSFRAYASNSPDGSPLYITEGAVYGEIELSADASLIHLQGETIYLRFYPIAGGQYAYSPDNMDALGIPSNVVALDWE
jgi:hypothetical protein